MNFFILDNDDRGAQETRLKQQNFSDSQLQHHVIYKGNPVDIEDKWTGHLGCICLSTRSCVPMYEGSF